MYIYVLYLCNTYMHLTSVWFNYTDKYMYMGNPILKGMVPILYHLESCATVQTKVPHFQGKFQF